MKRIYWFLACVFVAILMVSGCNSKGKAVFVDVETGPVQTIDLLVPQPEDPTGVELNLEFIYGNLKVSPGTNENLVSGIATYNAPDFKPQTAVNGSSYTLKTGDRLIEGLPKFKDDIINSWDVQLADTPMSLNLKAGPYNGEFELGGLALEKLYVDEIGSDVTMSFSQPNKVEMSSFTYMTGGSTMVLKGLANANFEQMVFQSGAGDFTLSFDGELQRDADVKIETGASTVNIIVPEGVNAQVAFDGAFTGVKFEDGWIKNDNIYTHSGSGPTITITVSMGMGDLNMKNE